MTLEQLSQQIADLRRDIDLRFGIIGAAVFPFRKARIAVISLCRKTQARANGAGK
jgi:hypothetical protein